MMKLLETVKGRFYLKVKNCLKTLIDYVRREKFSGYDPYDGLNSLILKYTLLNKISIVRLCWIQSFRRSPLNLRGVFLVRKDFNPKAGALFLLGNIGIFKLTGDRTFKKDIYELYNMLERSIIQRKSGCAWGYNFDWQTKAFFVPKGTPNIITTVYVGHALLKMLHEFNENNVKEKLSGIKNFLLNEMIIWEKKNSLCFAYIPDTEAEVHNVNLLAASFLSNVLEFGEKQYIEGIIKKAVNFSISDIESTGYWPYGTMPHHRWMDNFHTAFNLEALLSIKVNLQTNVYDDIIKKVFRYYIDNMFLSDGTPKYYHNKLYPVDIHTIAECIIILSKCIENKSRIFTKEDKEEARRLIDPIIQLSIQEFWNVKGYFYYQKNKYYLNKIPYMRWSQAWMFYALSCYQEMIGSSQDQSENVN